MSFVVPYKDDPFTIDAQAARTLGKDLAEAYQSADPFPHCSVDNFLPEAVAEYCLEHFPKQLGTDGQAYDRAQERYKASFNPDELESGLRNIFYTLNSRPFIQIIENITGIKGLIPDPYFMGGGFHETGQGGHLDVHTDFNHHKPMDLERRVNILIYLNKDWKPEYGGQLELWDKEMKECRAAINPVFNRMAMFSTTGISYHGHPEPVNHPEGKTRRSIALYYYTATWDSMQKRDLTTQFKVRPGTVDKTDWKVKSEQILTEILPPFMARPAVRLSRKLVK